MNAWLAEHLQDVRGALLQLPQRARASVRVLLLWMVLLALSLSGALSAPDGLIFDALVRVPPRWDGEPAVALVTVPASDARPVAVLRQAVVASGARAVVLMDGSADDDAARGSADARSCALEPVGGIARTVPLRSRDGTPCLLGRWASELGIDVGRHAPLSPDFSLRSSTAVPRVDMQGLEDGRLAAEVLTGRIAVLVRDADPDRYATPLLRVDGMLDTAVLHAMALDSLADGRAIRWAPRGVDVGLAFLVASLLTVTLRRVRFRPALIAVLSAAVPFLALCGLLLRIGGIHVPATAGLIAIGVLALRMLLRRNRLLGDALVELDHRLTGLVQQPLNRTFDQSPELTWEQVNHFVAHFFDLRRSMMLRLPPGAVHLVPVSSIGCTPDDIVEKRRDYRRAPYAQPLAREKPSVPSRVFLRGSDGLVDLIAPLIAADQLVGFWAFSVTDRPQAELDRLVLEAARYADELARVVLRSRDTSPVDPASRRLVPLAHVRARLLDAATRAREQLAAYRDVFSAVGHPIAVTDLLGRIQFANPRFEQLASAVGQPLLAMSLHNMLEQLCGLPPTEAKDVLRRVVLHASSEGIELPLRMTELPVEYSLHLHAIRRQLRTAAPTGSPFELLGLIVEISPTTPEADASARAIRASERYVHGMRALIDGMIRSLDRVSHDFPARDMLLDTLARGLDETRRVEGTLAAVATRGAGQRVAIDVQQLLHRLRQVHLRDAGAKNVEIDVADGDGRARMVYEQADALRTILDQVIALLVEDAAPGSRIGTSLALSDDGLSVVVKLWNRGYGLPPEHVAEVLRAGADVVAGSSALDCVAYAAHQLDASSVFQIASELGEGYRIELVVPRDPDTA